MSRKRAWCFTSYLDTEPFFDDNKTKYLTYGSEICPTTKRHHHQGYAEFKDAKTLSSVQKILKIPNQHVEPRNGTPEQAAMYCKKDGEFKEFGKMSEQGARTDITKKVREHCEQGLPLADIIDQVSYQGARHAELIYKYKEPKRTVAPEVYWFYGPPGAGKTRAAYDLCPDLYAESEGKWFDGYDCHKHVLLDDYRPDDFKFKKLLRLLDRYPTRVETKGGSRQFLAEKIFVTTPYHPREYVPHSEHPDQLLRRITEIREFPEPTI